MKNKKLWLIFPAAAVFALALLLAVGLILRPLPPDGLAVDDLGVLYWEGDDRATSYTVDIDGKIYTTDVWYMDIFDITDEYKTYTVTVTAKGFLGFKRANTISYDLPALPEDAFVFGLRDDEKSFIVALNPDVAVSGKVIIPSSHDGKPVTGVASFGFESRQDLTSVFIPDSITNIGGEAFAVDKNLQRIRFSENLKTIGKEAFLGCMSLGKIIFPESLRDVYDRAFFGCQLKEIYFQGNTNVGFDVFYGNAIDHFTVSPNGSVLSASSFDYFIGNTPMPVICPSTAFYSSAADNRPLKGVIYTDAKTIPANWSVVKDGLLDESPRNPIFLNCTFEGAGADMYLTSLTHTRIEYLSDFVTFDGAVDCRPYRKGYTFVGWTTKKGDTKVEYTMEQLLSKTPPHNWPYEFSPVSQPIVPYGTTLYPIWEEIKTYDK